MKNSYDSFKADVKDVAGFVILVGIIFWAVFYPFAIMVGASNLKDPNDKPEYWRRFWRAPATWLWVLCVAALTVMILAQWGILLP